MYKTLLVFDNYDLLEEIKKLSIWGDSSEFEITDVVSDGVSAYRKIRENRYDLVITEIRIMGMDGLQLLRNVKKEGICSHIVLCSEFEDFNYARQGIILGAYDYFVKPFDETLLLTRIQNILENRKRYQRKFTLNMDVDVLNMEEESGDKKFLNQVMEVIKENYKNSYFEVSDFSEAVGVSKSLLNKKLQSLIGQSAGQFIRNYRLNIARELILKNRETKNMNIAEIAYEVGFNDPKYFTRCFTKYFNTTPSSLLNKEE